MLYFLNADTITDHIKHTLSPFVEKLQKLSTFHFSWKCLFSPAILRLFVCFDDILLWIKKYDLYFKQVVL